MHRLSAPDGHSQLLTVLNVIHLLNKSNFVVDQQTETLVDSSSRHNNMLFIHNTTLAHLIMMLLLFKFKSEHQFKDYMLLMHVFQEIAQQLAVQLVIQLMLLLKDGDVMKMDSSHCSCVNLQHQFIVLLIAIVYGVALEQTSSVNQ